MQIIKSLLKLVIFICPVFATAQTTFIQQGDKAYQLLERMEIKAKTNSNFNFSNLRYFSRKVMMEEVMAADSMNKTMAADAKNASKLTPIGTIPNGIAVTRKALTAGNLYSTLFTKQNQTYLKSTAKTFF